jgi:uncharacterized protein YggE
MLTDAAATEQSSGNSFMLNNQSICTSLTLSSALWLALLGSLSAQTQNPAQVSNAAPLLTVTAQESVTLKPIAIQMRTTFRAEDRTAADAVTKLQDHCQSAQKMLIDLAQTANIGEGKSNFQWNLPVLGQSVPFVDNPETAKQWLRRQAAQMQVNNPQMRGKLREMLLQEEEDLDGEADPLPLVHTASKRLVAEWAINPDQLDAAVEFGAKLRQISQDKLFRGTKLRVQLSEEELEQIMPLMGASAYVSSSSSNITSAGEGQVLYVGALSEDEEAQAMKRAFERAKGQAARLASAAGKQLGEVKMITTTSQSPTFANQVVTANGSIATTNSALEFQDRAEKRCLHPNPNELVLSISVQVGFEIR